MSSVAAPGAHIVRPIAPGTSIGDAVNALTEAHDQLAAAGLRHAAELAEGDLASWGTRAKRVEVTIEAGAAELLTPRKHNFAEVVNQCATLERLLHALHWAAKEFAGYEVVECHPSTSSGDKTTSNDLVLRHPADGAAAHFEVSDVLTGIQKELKDLRSLRVFADGNVMPWPAARLFLVVAPELGERLRPPTRHGLRRGLLRYEERDHAHDESTVIFEVVRGPNATATPGQQERDAE